ncbi:hypothetical protein ykris0001_24660 [Yersinia kristensenii ATCC 33638]|nr:hypothetical protein ykris0001_24660 [Yersinia kristensenii ATCC 33638]
MGFWSNYEVKNQYYDGNLSYSVFLEGTEAFFSLNCASQG